MNVKEYLTKYYENSDEDARLRSRHGMVEYLTTMRYVKRYLRPGMRIIEIGAGTGRYSHSLARGGYSVDAVELTEHNIAIFKQNTIEGEPVTIARGNATDLSTFESDCYDVTLLLGPMYHLFTTEDKQKALSEAIRVTKKGGTVFSAYCLNEATMIQFCFKRGAIRDPEYYGKIDKKTFKCASEPSEIFELYRKEEIDELMSLFNVARLHYVGTDMFTRYISECVDDMDDETFERYLKYHFTICERADCVGVSNHSLDIFRKE